MQLCMILIIAADAWSIHDDRNAQFAKLVGRTDPGTQQQRR